MCAMSETLQVAGTLSTEGMPAETVNDLIREACRKLWEGNDVEPGLRRPFENIETGSGFAAEGVADEAFEAGVNAAVTVWGRLIPGPNPVDGVHHDIVQLWTHQRYLLAHDIENTRLLTELRQFIVDKFEEYQHLLPKPGSLAARAGAWGSRNGR